MDGNTNAGDLVQDEEAYFETSHGAAYQGDSRELLEKLPENSVNLVVTSPPFGLRKKKEYGNKDPEDYNKWFLEFVDRVYDILTEDGSFVVDIGGGWESGKPVRSLYHFELLTEIAGENGPFNLAQDFYWYNPAKLPTPAQWVTIERIRVKDAVNHVWWFSKSERPNADNRRVLKEYSDSQKKLMKDGYRDKMRPSGHDISDTFDDPENADGAIRPNFWNVIDSSDYAPEFIEVLQDADVSEELIQVADENDLLDELVESVLSQHVDDNVLELANTASNTHYLKACKEVGVEPHPARFPRQLPEFFIKFLTEKDDIVLDIFAGSNQTGRVAQDLERQWLAFEYQEKYLQTATLRFTSMDELEKPENQSDWDDIADLID